MKDTATAFALFKVDKYENYTLSSWWDSNYSHVEMLYKKYRESYPENRYVILKRVVDTDCGV